MCSYFMLRLVYTIDLKGCRRYNTTVGSPILFAERGKGKDKKEEGG